MARSRHRSVAYDLEASVAVARAVAAAGGDATPAEIASALGYRGTNNGAFRSRLASARCFGLVAGRGSRVLLSERGQAVLSGEEPASAQARAAAFFAVPLFGAVAGSPSARSEHDPTALAHILVEEFGETPTKAVAAAGRLLDSAVQAGLARFGQGIPRLAKAPDKVAERTQSTSNLFLPVVRFPRSSGSIEHRAGAGRRGRPMVADRDTWGAPPDGDEDLWLDDGEGGHRRPGPIRRVGVVAAAVACLALVGVPTGLVLSSGGANVALPPPHVSHQSKTPAHLGNGPAEQHVVAALSATTDAGSFDFTYAMTQTGATIGRSNVTCAQFGGAPCTSATSRPKHRTVVSGKGTLDTDPLGMVASTSLGPSVRVDATDYWEGSTGTGLAASTTSSPGSPLSSFAGLVESALGSRGGGVAMLAMASPTGFLDLAQTEVTGADQVGTTTVGGTQLTEYDVSLDPTQLASTPASTADESTTIEAALGVLKQQGLTGTTAHLGIDASGYIHQAAVTATFSDGGTVTLSTTLSTFGCAGTVLMPGQQGTTAPPAGCASPDTDVAPAAQTTTSTTTTTTGVPSTSTTSPTVAPSVATTTTSPTASGHGTAPATAPEKPATGHG